MANHANNSSNPNNGNEVNNIPPPPIVEVLYYMICQIQDQNRKLIAEMEVMNWENARRENEASSHHHSDDPTQNDEEDNSRHTDGKNEMYHTATTLGLLVYSGPFSEFIRFVALLDNFKLPTTLRPYNVTRDPQVHVTILKSMMLVNRATNSFLCRTFSTFLEKAALLWFLHYL